MRKIELRGKYGKGLFAFVDDEDFKKVSQYKWQYYGRYAEAKINHKTTYMHRLILNTPKGKNSDHINGDKLDNRRRNLRICTQSENMGNRKLQANNTSGYKGVFPVKNRWRAEIKKNGIKYFLGSFKTKEEAGKAYNIAHATLHKDFAKLNKLKNNQFTQPTLFSELVQGRKKLSKRSNLIH